MTLRSWAPLQAAASSREQRDNKGTSSRPDGCSGTQTAASGRIIPTFHSLSAEVFTGSLVE